MRIYSLNAFMMSLVTLFSCMSVCTAGEVKSNPHSDSGDCSICHVAPEDKLRSWFVFGSTKRAMKTDLNQLCLKCHTIVPVDDGSLGVGIGHATGKKPSVNYQDLPLAGDGTITCATTCHNMHVTSADRQLRPKRLRLPANLLCMSCHDM